MLNDFGKLAVAEIFFYIPVLAAAIFVTIKHGFNRRAGWLLLLLFAIGKYCCQARISESVAHRYFTVRILGSVLLIISQTTNNPSNGLLTAVGIVQGLGLSPLLLTTTSIIGNM